MNFSNIVNTIDLGKKTKRYIWVDWAKALLIYIMVVGHCFPEEHINRMIYAFHMPAFFIISGYLYHEHSWFRTLKSFALPLVVFSLVNFLLIVFPQFIKGTFTSADFIERIYVPYWGGTTRNIDYLYLFPGCWFVFALLLGRFLMGDIPAFRWIREHSKISIFVLLVWLVIEPFIFPNHSNPLEKYKFYRVIPSLPFLLLGYKLKSYNLCKIFNIRNACIFAFVFVCISSFQGYCNILDYKFGISYIVFYFNAIIGSLAFFGICNYCKRSILVEKLSTGTILVLAFNISLIYYVKVFISHSPLSFMVDDVWICPWLIALLVVAICFVPILILLKYWPAVLGK